MEWVVVKQLMEHINSNNVHNHERYAFKTDRFTETASLHIRIETHLTLSSNEPTVFVFLSL